MEAKDLKIGNITDKGTIKTFWESGIHVGFGITFHFIGVGPVKIDINLLLQLGFVYDNGKYIFTDKETRCKFKIARNTAGCWFCHLGKRYYFSYIHELQNLYSSLYPGRELKK